MKISKIIFVFLTVVPMLALGAAIGTPAFAISFRAIGSAGQRTATLGKPAVTISGTCACFGNTTESGPGQNRSIRSLAR